MQSCDPASSRQAVQELVRDPLTLREPLLFFDAALAERMAGRKEEAAFLFLVARLRTSRQILFERGDRPQLLQVMLMTVGPQVLPVMTADPALARRVVDRAVDWDRATPDPFRDRPDAKSGDMPGKLAAIDQAMRRIPQQLAAQGADAAVVRDMDEQFERQRQAEHAARCGPGTLDPVEAEALTKRIQRQAENLVRAHPAVIAQAGGAVKSTSVGSYRHGPGRFPSRLTVSVTPAAGQPFYAEVDALVTIRPERKLDAVRFSLACTTRLWIGQRDAAWKDVCRDDPNAVRPAAADDAQARQFDIGG